MIVKWTKPRKETRERKEQGQYDDGSGEWGKMER
jgi:hypothetical protein